MGTYDPAQRRGAGNYGRYSNPALDKLTDEALATFNNSRREGLLQQAVAMAMDVSVDQLLGGAEGLDLQRPWR